MHLLRLPVFLLVGVTLLAQDQRWEASWIAVQATRPQDYGVYHFRRTFDLASKPEHLRVRVSADNRYQLFANGELVSWGPARGDLTHWRYETIDLAPHLRTGKNVLAAVVWNDGPERAVAQISSWTGFVLQVEDAAAESLNGAKGGDARPETGKGTAALGGASPDTTPVLRDVLNTNKQWLGVRDEAYSALPIANDQRTGYYALGPDERLDAALYPWGWETIGFDDSKWLPAAEISRASDRYARDAPNAWMLVPRGIPLEERTLERPFTVREGALPVTVPANSKQNVLLDLTYLTTGYPELTVSGGKGAVIQLRYAESPFISTNPVEKRNRNEIENKIFVGPADAYVLDGGKRTFRPLYWRTYRYVRVEIATGDEPVTVQNVRSIFTGYPFQRRAQFQTSNDEELQRILDTGWRTARLCAHETYMDCPYYEQLQYAGDARIQMLISLFETGDARLMKNGIELLNSSRTAEGATYSRAPSHLQQYIPGFSLWWIGMVHDYFWYVNDPEFVRAMLPGVRAVLSFFHGYQKGNGSLRKLPWWPFVDWAHDWDGGDPPAEADGSSAAASDLQLLLAYDWAADLENALGDKALAAEDRAAAEQLRQTVKATDWDVARGLFADQPSHRTWSQQTNTLAVLGHVVAGPDARAVVEKMLADKTMTQSSIYFLAYTNATLREVGLGGRYLDQLGPWKQMLQEGLTTLSEWNGPDTRSDCHAWGASPNFEVLRTIAGIDSAAAGFSRVVVRPNLGSLSEVKASMPHPNGVIEVDLTPVRAVIDLPGGVPGELDWQGKIYPLHAGHNAIELK